MGECLWFSSLIIGAKKPWSRVLVGRMKMINVPRVHRCMMNVGGEFKHRSAGFFERQNTSGQTRFDFCQREMSFVGTTRTGAFWSDDLPRPPGLHRLLKVTYGFITRPLAPGYQTMAAYHEIHGGKQYELDRKGQNDRVLEKRESEDRGGLIQSQRFAVEDMHVLQIDTPLGWMRLTPLSSIALTLKGKESMSLLRDDTCTKGLPKGSPTGTILAPKVSHRDDPCTFLKYVVTGGTAFNGVVEELKKLTTSVAHVLPVSDDGGSTAEIVVQQLARSSLRSTSLGIVRLSDQSTSRGSCCTHYASGFVSPLDAQQAKLEWYSIVEGEHPLWKDVSKPYRETIRAILAYFQNQSLDAAIFLFSRVSQIPTESLVLPVISTNDRLTLGCELWDGTIIRGQNEISHPASGSLQLIDKGNLSALPSMIKRVFYMSSEGSNLLHEVFPTVNPSVLEQLRNVDCIIYGMGSLFTSICPSLVLLGVGEIISSRSCAKVLLLNGTYDRETSGFSASCFVTAITDALNRTYGHLNNSLKNNPSQYINTIFVPKDGQIPVDIKSLAAQGIVHVVPVESMHDPKVGIVYEPTSLIQALANLLTGSTNTQS
ncbi:maternal effect embryo arrest 18 [Tanacetum coccineum]